MVVWFGNWREKSRENPQKAEKNHKGFTALKISQAMKQGMVWIELSPEV